MERRKVLLLTWEAFVGDELSEQLNKVFQNQLELLNWCPGSTKTPYGQISLIVCTIQALRQVALEAGVIQEETPYIVAHRNITSAGLLQLERLMRLQPGTRVAVCSNNMDASQSIVQYLESLNITHLNLIPYSRNAGEIDISGVHVAIVFGYPNTQPPGVENIIDLGKRVLDDQTIINMIQIGGFNAEIAQLAASVDQQATISVASQLAQALDRREEISSQLAAVLKCSPNGIMITDRDYCIIQCNNIMLEALHKTPEEIYPGQSLEDVSEELSVVVKTVNMGGKSSRIWTLNNADYLISVYKVGTKQLQEYKIIVLQKVPIYQLKNAAFPENAHKSFRAKYQFDDIRTRDPDMEKLKQFAMKIARSDGNVAIYGESGTGKELFAQAIHNHSHRREGPFVPVNVSALHDSLIESELFGYAEGAFTGAKRGGKPGLFELADNGTIFLDEIGDLSLSLQAKLLRTIQEREVVRVGGAQIIPINVRIIAATNKNLSALVHEEKFRQDLFYRLNVLPLNLLPLRKRKADINLLLQEKLESHGLPLSLLSKDNIQRLLEYSWPGNVRELENVCVFLSCLSNLDTEEFDSQLYSYIQNNHFTESSPRNLNKLSDDALCFQVLTDMVSSQKNKSLITTKAIYNRLHSSCGLSMASLRECLKKLEKSGMITIGRTRQGMQITEKGFSSVKA